MLARGTAPSLAKATSSCDLARTLIVSSWTAPILRSIAGTPPWRGRAPTSPWARRVSSLASSGVSVSSGGGTGDTDGAYPAPPTALRVPARGPDLGRPSACRRRSLRVPARGPGQGRRPEDGRGSAPVLERVGGEGDEQAERRDAGPGPEQPPQRPVRAEHEGERADQEPGHHDRHGHPRDGAAVERRVRPGVAGHLRRELAALLEFPGAVPGAARSGGHRAAPSAARTDVGFGVVGHDACSSCPAGPRARAASLVPGRPRSHCDAGPGPGGGGPRLCYYGPSYAARCRAGRGCAGRSA